MAHRWLRRVLINLIKASFPAVLHVSLSTYLTSRFAFCLISRITMTLFRLFWGGIFWGFKNYVFTCLIMT